MGKTKDVVYHEQFSTSHHIRSIVSDETVDFDLQLHSLLRNSSFAFLKFLAAWDWGNLVMPAQMSVSSAFI